MQHFASELVPLLAKAPASATWGGRAGKRPAAAGTLLQPRAGNESTPRAYCNVQWAPNRWSASKPDGKALKGCLAPKTNRPAGLTLFLQGWNVSGSWWFLGKCRSFRGNRYSSCFKKSKAKTTGNRSIEGKMQISFPKSTFKPTVFSKSHMVQRDENTSCCCSSGPAHQGFLH